MSNSLYRRELRFQLVTLIFVLGICLPSSGFAQDKAKPISSVVPVHTASPRDTLATFERLSSDFEKAFGAYLKKRDKAHAERMELLAGQVISLIDLSAIPATTRSKVGGETAAYLLDIFDRIGMPDLNAVPANESVSENALGFAIPNTPFKIVRIQSGENEGEFLFSGDTVRFSPRFYRSIEHLPLQSSLPYESWSVAIRQITGPMIPLVIANNIPPRLQHIYLDAPLWKILSATVLLLLAGLAIAMLHQIVARSGAISGRFRPILVPAALVVTTLLLQNFFLFQLNLAGEFARFVNTLCATVINLSLVWAFWILVTATAEAILRRSSFLERGIDASMLRLTARIIGAIGGAVILAVGAQELGLPVFSILAGLGIGGLAVALAIRPTLENLISGFILYLDRPIRVGDFCTFGDQSGTVESIGVRSTQIRARDRTRISIPNSQFADMQIINWAQCDQMMIKHVIGLRYETDTDQLRFVIARIREMLYGHPRIESDTVRVRFLDFGTSSLDIEVRVYARTRDWNDFYAIREDLLFRIKDIVEQSGTGFAFPSQSVYLSRDLGLNEQASEQSRIAVEEWRKAGVLPFPHSDPRTIEKINDRLFYPPEGSPEHDTVSSGTGGESLEPLSSGPSDGPKEGES